MLTRRLWSAVEGAHYEGEILRFRLQAAPLLGVGSYSAADAHADAREDRIVELRISRKLLAKPGWSQLEARDVAHCAEHFLRERLQQEGLPSAARASFTLDASTDTGAYVSGPPWGADSPAPGMAFELPGPPHATGAPSAHGQA
ncbi:MAG: hypothetical protein DHS20C15_06920 [Planctomycetota bacterium]|nr:MAG: hypothetical protein DHS20C15_06920 [Planctomycetota bacterium]